MADDRKSRVAKSVVLSAMVAHLISQEEDNGSVAIAKALRKKFSKEAWEEALIHPKDREGADPRIVVHPSLEEEVAEAIFEVYFEMTLLKTKRRVHNA